MARDNTPTRLHMLRIEVDAYFNGASEVPQPWVARLDGTDSRFGLAREFVQRLNDWSRACRSIRGRTRGVVATFPLRSGHMYEVSRTRGRSTKRVVREFLRVGDGRHEMVEPLDALAAIEGHRDDVTLLRLLPPDGQSAGTVVHEVSGIGAGSACGWVLIGDRRHYRLRHGRLYEVHERGARRLVMGGPSIETVSEREALLWLAERV